MNDDDDENIILDHRAFNYDPEPVEPEFPVDPYGTYLRLVSDAKEFTEAEKLLRRWTIHRELIGRYAVYSALKLDSDGTLGRMEVHEAYNLLRHAAIHIAQRCDLTGVTPLSDILTDDVVIAIVCWEQEEGLDVMVSLDDMVPGLDDIDDRAYQIVLHERFLARKNQVVYELSLRHRVNT